MTPLPFGPDVAEGDREHRSSPFAGVPTTRRRRVVGRLSGVLAVAAGGALGGCGRYGVGQVVPAGAGGFVWPTFLVNVAGSFCLALLLVLVLEVWPPTRYVRPFVAVGLLGSLTTFSTWMVELDLLASEGDLLLAAIYLAASVLTGVAATGLGLVIGRGVAARRPRTSTKGR